MGRSAQAEAGGRWSALRDAALRKPWAMVIALDLVFLGLSVGGLVALRDEDVATPVPTVAPTRTQPAVARPVRPPRTGYPTAADTGPLGPLVPSGPLTISQPGAVVEGLDVTGEINVTAPDVTIRNVRVRSGSAAWLLVTRNDTGTTTLDGVSVEAESGAAVGRGVFQIGNGRLVVANSRILGTQDGCVCSRGAITDSYIRLGPNQHGAHNDGIQSGGGRGLLIRHNTILNPNGQTSAIALFEEFGPQVDVRVEDNLLAGGGYTIYAGSGKKRPSAVRVVGNVFSRRFFRTGGSYGPATAWCGDCPGAAWSRNVWEGTGRAVEP
jgi:hypothetical protein